MGVDPRDLLIGEVAALRKSVLLLPIGNRRPCTLPENSVNAARIIVKDRKIPLNATTLIAGQVQSIFCKTCRTIWFTTNYINRRLCSLGMLTPWKAAQEFSVGLKRVARFRLFPQQALTNAVNDIRAWITCTRRRCIALHDQRVRAVSLKRNVAISCNGLHHIRLRRNDCILNQGRDIARIADDDGHALRDIKATNAFT